MSLPSPPDRPGTTAGVGVSAGDEAAIAAAGSATEATAATTIQRRAMAEVWEADSRSPSRRASVGTSSGIEAKRRRYAGHAGMRRRQNVFAWMSARGEKPLTTRNAAEPAAQQRRDGAASHAEHGEQAGERRPLGEPSAPEELAQLSPSASSSARSRARSSGRGRARRASARTGCDARLLEREGGKLAQSPRSFQSARTSSAGTIAAAQARPSRHRRATTIGETDAAADQEVRRLQSRRRADEDARRAPRRSSGRVESERTTKSAAASTSTIDGKSAIAVSPSA